MELHLKIVGCLLVIISLLHMFFPKYFEWRKELLSLSMMNRQMMYVHLFFIALGVLLVGLLCLTSPFELLNTTLGKRISLGLGIFWTARLYVQFFGFSSKLWRGKRNETTVHILFSILWTYVSAIFILAYLT